MEKKLYNLDTLSEIVDHDEKELKEMLQMFIELSPSIQEEMIEAHEEYNYKKLSNLAHKLKSNLRLLEIDELVDVARSIEKKSKDATDRQGIDELMDKINKTLPDIVSQIKTDEL